VNSLEFSLQKHFIELVFLETIELVLIDSNGMLTRQTCGQHSSRVVESKRRALAFCFSIRIWHVFLISKCRGDSNLGLCMSLVLAKRMPLRSADFRFKNVFLAAEFVRSQHCAVAFSLQVVNSCTDLDPTLVCISILRAYTKFVRENKMLALGVCFPQPCSSACRRFAASRSRLNYYRTIDSFPQDRIR